MSVFASASLMLEFGVDVRDNEANFTEFCVWAHCQKFLEDIRVFSFCIIWASDEDFSICLFFC